MDFEQLERDIAPFAHINSQAAATGALSPSDQEKLQALGVSIAKKHIDFFATFFATSLFEIDHDPHLEQTESRGYSFKDVDDAANCFEMTIVQVVDQPRARAVGMAVLLVFLQRCNRNPSISIEEANALVRTIAQLAHGYRYELFQEFVQHGQELLRQDSKKRWTKILVIAAISALVIWLITK